ncbi:MAG: hypothetical protein IJM64_05350 [Ottowia sp.]|nr:hypothetical protein [Ottowia sp.]
MKAIAIFQIVFGAIGIVLGSRAFGDIAFAAIGASLASLMSGIGFLHVAGRRGSMWWAVALTAVGIAGLLASKLISETGAAALCTIVSLVLMFCGAGLLIAPRKPLRGASDEDGSADVGEILLQVIAVTAAVSLTGVYVYEEISKNPMNAFFSNLQESLRGVSTATTEAAPEPSELAPAAEEPQASASPAEPEAPKPNWTYSESRDEMRNEVGAYFARAISKNEVNLGFPHGKARLLLTLRKSKKQGDDVMLTISEGQMDCLFQGCEMSARFDDEPVQTVRMAGSSDFLSGTIFIARPRAAREFAAKLKKHQRLIVEVPLSNRLPEQFSFDISGLEWEHF